MEREGKGREGKGRGGGREVVAIPNANANLGLAGGGQSPFVQVIPSAACRCRTEREGKGREGMERAVAERWLRLPLGLVSGSRNHTGHTPHLLTCCSRPWTGHQPPSLFDTDVHDHSTREMFGNISVAHTSRSTTMLHAVLRRRQMMWKSTTGTSIALLGTATCSPTTRSHILLEAELPRGR